MINLDNWLKSLKINNLSHALLLIGTDRDAFFRVTDRMVNLLNIAPFDRHDIVPEDIQAPSIPIASIRQLKSSLSQKPYSSYHLVLIPEAAALTVEAQQALLKTLEEPPSPAIMMLGTPDEHLLLPTVVSRCQRIAVGQTKSKEAALPLTEISFLPLDQVFRRAEEMAKDDRLPAILDAWIFAARPDLYQGRGVSLLKLLLKIKERLLATQANKRLLLEELFLAVRFPEHPKRIA